MLGQMYQSKKDETVLAKVIKENEKSKTFILEYTTGEKAGKNFDISSATLKRWWRKHEVETAEEVQVPTEQEMAEAIKEVEKEEPEVFKVEVEDDVTGEIKQVTITSDMGVSDEVIAQYNFNPSEDEKVQMKKPNTLRYLDSLVESPWPSYEQLTDMVVEWGGAVKRIGEYFITLLDGSRVTLFWNTVQRAGRIEVRVKNPDLVKSFTVEEKPSKQALNKKMPYVVTLTTLDELKTLIQEIS